MKIFTLKRLLLATMFFLTGCLAIHADGPDQQVVVRLDKAGTLPQKINDSQKYQITDLKIIGDINGTDVKLIRDMAGISSEIDTLTYWLKVTDGKLANLDLSEARIVAGGDVYYHEPYDTLSDGDYTEDDKIGPNFFNNCKLTNITLPSGITEIGTFAFGGCVNLTSLDIPSGVTKIWDVAFLSCENIKSINIPSSVREIGMSAFGNCHHLTDIPTLPASITEIGFHWFDGCTGLTSIVIPSRIKKIGQGAFQGCTNLKSVTIPENVTEIEYNAFSNCKSLTTINIPSGVTELEGTFKGCTSLTTINIPSSVTELGSTFEGCTSLTSIKIPMSVTTITGKIIPSRTFYGCTGLKSIYLCSPEPYYIYGYALYNVSKQNCTIYVPRGSYDKYKNSSWGQLFDNIVEFNLTKKDRAITVRQDVAGTLPQKITDNTKYQITDLKIIGDINGTDVKLIRDMACKKGQLGTIDLSEAHIVAGGDYYCYGPNNRYNYTEGNKFGDFFFYECDSLRNIILPQSITKIGTNAFPDSLTSLIIPEGVTEIGSIYCQNLTNLIIPNGVIEMGSITSQMLTSINIPSSVKKLGGFYMCSSLTSLIIPDGLTEIADYFCSYCIKLTSINIPAGVTRIGIAAFDNCRSLKKLDIPMGVTEIGSGAFGFCQSLKKIHIPSGVTRIPFEAFVLCDSLTECNIPEGVTFIGRCAFSGCKSLKSIDIPKSVEKIDLEAFENCKGLKSVYVSWETPLDIDFDVFNRKRTCILYVPLGTKSLYYDSTWGDCFDNIVEYDVDGINDAITAEQSEEVARYSADGQRLSAPAQGLNIVKYSDGSVRKVMVR